MFAFAIVSINESAKKKRPGAAGGMVVIQNTTRDYMQARRVENIPQITTAPPNKDTPRQSTHHQNIHATNKLNVSYAHIASTLSSGALAPPVITIPIKSRRRRSGGDDSFLIVPKMRAR